MVSLEMRFVCGQCQKDMQIQGVKQRNPEPTLVCPECGFKVQVIQQFAVPKIPMGDKRIPALRPRKLG